MNKTTTAMLVALVALVALGGPATATAAPASQADAEALSAIYGQEARCSVVIQSDIDPTYFAWFSNGSDGCPVDGIYHAAIRQPDGTFRSVLNGYASVVLSCEETVLPPEVGSEIGVCQVVDKRGYLLSAGLLKFKPKVIPNGAHSAVTGLKWQGWGTSRSVGKGTFVYSDRTLSFKGPVTVTLSKRVTCFWNRVYLRSAIRFTRKADRKRWGRTFSATLSLTCDDIEQGDV